MRLFRVEVRRLLSRRLFRMMVLLSFLALVFTIAETSYNSRGPTAAEQAKAEKLASQAAQQHPLAELIKKCEQQKAAGKRAKGVECKAATHEPRAKDFVPDGTFHFVRQMPNRIVGFGVILAILGFVVGASFLGADWSAGTLAGLLIWEPRRLRVLAAKAADLVVVLAMASVLVMAATVAAHYGIAVARGDGSGATEGQLISTGFAALRGVGLGVGAGLIGFALAGSLRHTSAALGLAFAYFVGAELALRQLWKGSAPWLLTSNVGAWLLKGFRITLATSCGADGTCVSKQSQVSFVHGAVYLGVLVLMTLAICFLTFRRRDVT